MIQELKNRFKKVYLNRYRALDYRKTMDGTEEPAFFIYKSPYLCKMSQEAFQRGEEWFFCEPADPKDPDGKMIPAEPRFVYRMEGDLSPEEYGFYFDEQDA